jgi:hypothetical protein
MKVYRRRYTGEPFAEHAPIYETEYAGTLDDAKELLRGSDVKPFWNDIVIEEITVRDDKVGLISAMNGEPLVASVNRCWGITNRGGLKEEKVE